MPVFLTFIFVGGNVCLPHSFLIAGNFENPVNGAGAYKQVAVFKFIYITTVAANEAFECIELDGILPDNFTAIFRFLRDKKDSGQRVEFGIVVTVEYGNGTIG